MKKILALFIFLFFIAPSFAEVFFAPEWSEFCPKKYANVSTTRWHYTSSGRYWSERRKVFEQRLEKCNSFTGADREACYKSLRELENNATQNYTNNGSSRALKYMMINSMF